MSRNNNTAGWSEAGRWDFGVCIFEDSESVMKWGPHIELQLHTYLYLFHKNKLNKHRTVDNRECALCRRYRRMRHCGSYCALVYNATHGLSWRSLWGFAIRYQQGQRSCSLRRQTICQATTGAQTVLWQWRDAHYVCWSGIQFEVIPLRSIPKLKSLIRSFWSTVFGTSINEQTHTRTTQAAQRLSVQQ